MSLTKRLLGGAAQLTIANAVIRLLSIFTMPILTSLLSPKDYGDAALIGTIIALASVVALAGIDVTYARSYHSAQTPNGVIVEAFCWRFVFVTATAAALVIGVAVWLIPAAPLHFNFLTGLLLVAGVLWSPINAMALTRARLQSRYRAISLVTIGSGIFCAASSVAIAIFWRRDAAALVVPVVLGYFLPPVLLGIPISTVTTRRPGLNFKQGAALVSVGLAGIITAPLYWLLSSSDRWFLQFFHGPDSVGIYSVGYSVAIVGSLLNAALMSVWLPEASKEYERDPEEAKNTLGRLIGRLAIILALVWLVISAAGGDIVRWVANPRFHDSAKFLPLLAGAVFFYGTSQLLVATLVLVKKFHWAGICWLVCGLLSVVLNMALVPSLGMVGAALTQLASFGCLSMLIFLAAQRFYHLHLSYLRLSVCFTIILIAAHTMAPPWNVTAPISIIEKLPLGMSVAAICFWVIAPDWFRRGLQIMIRHT